MTKPCVRKYFPTLFKAPIRDRLDAKTMVDPNSGCWLWAGDTNGKYPSIMLRRDGKSVRKYAHRLSYEIHIGPIPDGLCIDHKCRTPMCINPAHLRCVTHLENIRAKPFHLQGARMRQLSPFCKSGHLRTPESITIIRRKDGSVRTQCKICRKNTCDKNNKKRRQKNDH